MDLLVASANLEPTVLIRALLRQLHDKTSDGDVGLESTNDSHVAKRTASCVLDAFLTEQVVATRGLYRVLVYIQANWADPSIIGQARCREISESLRAI